MTDQPPEGRCGHPTQRGGLCKKHPMAGSDRCHHHAGLAPTAAERAASKTNPVKHGYFVSGFLSDEERELFQAAREGELDRPGIQADVIAALIVRAARITAWEAEGKQVSGFATEVFTELRKSLEAISPEELRVEHSWDDAEVAEQVQRILREDGELLLEVVPEAAREAVAQALEDREM